MALPFLPGNTFRDPTRTNYAKTQSLGYRNGYALPSRGGPTPGAPDYADDEFAAYAGQDPTLTYGRRETNTMPTFVPAHVMYDKMVLSFQGYFKEHVVESNDENYRIRRVSILFYLEDDTIQVNERKQANSGLNQGVLIKRQLIPKGNGAEFYCMWDFNVGEEVTLYGRTFYLNSCDAFTREYLSQNGVEVGEDERQPEDPYTTKRRALESKTRTFRDTREDDKLRRFLMNDRKVLRFSCLWDDRDGAAHELRPFNLHYFLVDDTVEVREVHTTNDGRDPFPLLLRRNKLPKGSVDLTQFGTNDQEIYTEEDFEIGMTVNVFGRKFFIYDCDEYTREFYRVKFNRAMDPIVLSRDESGPPLQQEVPPPTGFGTDEDSLVSVYSLQPKPPKKDFVKLMSNDGKILRFAAQLVTTDAINKKRRFVVSFYLADDTVQVFEPPERNSGIMGGKFLERCPCKRPDTGDRYIAQDFYVGAVVELVSHRFLLTDADEYAFKFMEEHCDEFPQADLDLIISEIGQTLADRGMSGREAFTRFDTDSSGTVSGQEFEAGIMALGVDLTGHNLLTLMRRFDADGNGRISCREFCDAIDGGAQGATRSNNGGYF